MDVGSNVKPARGTVRCSGYSGITDRLLRCCCDRREATGVTGRGVNERGGGRAALGEVGVADGGALHGEGRVEKQPLLRRVIQRTLASLLRTPCCFGNTDKSSLVVDNGVTVAQ